MVSPDPNPVRVTGENSFVRLHQGEGEPEITRASHWRVLWSPAGQGHLLSLKSDVTDNEVRFYSDNIALARWLQEEIESFLYPEFNDPSIPVIDAFFEKSGDGSSFWTETVESEEDTIALTWYDFKSPFLFHAAPGAVPGRKHGVYSCFVPARRAQLTVNGLVAQGKPISEARGPWESSTATLALSETWVRED